MRSPTRKLFWIASLLFLLAGLLALAYVLWPLATANLQTPLPPTLFAPP